MALKPLTERQEEILTFIEGYASTQGFPPTLREIGEKVGLSNVNAVRGHLAALEKKGYISKDPDKARSIRVLRPPSPLSKFLRTLHEIAGTDKGVVHHVVYGLAWRTAGPRGIAGDEAASLVEEAFEQQCVERGWRLIEAKIEPNVVRVIIQVWPNHSAEQVVRRLKRAGNAIRLRHADVFTDKDLWAKGYVATTDPAMLDALVEQLIGEGADGVGGED